MNFLPTPEQQELKNAVRQFVTAECTPERLLAWESDPSGVDETTRRAVADLGWIGVGVPEEAGGTGGTLVDLAFLVEECARGLLPRPLIGAIRAAAALACTAGARRSTRTRLVPSPSRAATRCRSASSASGT